MASLQQQMLTMTSQLQQLQSMTAGIDPVPAADAGAAGPMQQQQCMGNALLLPQLSNVSTLSSTLQHPAWLL
jgi:hypothetical protein